MKWQHFPLNMEEWRVASADDPNYSVARWRDKGPKARRKSKQRKTRSFERAEVLPIKRGGNKRNTVEISLLLPVHPGLSLDKYRLAASHTSRFSLSGPISPRSWRVCSSRAAFFLCSFLPLVFQTFFSVRRRGERRNQRSNSDRTGIVRCKGFREDA